jgi:hypothetical protein
LRSCTLNLIVLAQGADEGASISAALTRLGAAHPIRALIIVPDPDAPQDGMRSWLKIACGGKDSAGTLCSVEVLLAGAPENVEQTLSAVRALLAPDLPVVLWWRGGPPLRDRLYVDLAAYAAKIIVDSARFGDGESALDTLRRVIECNGRRAAVADFNWQRTRAWRLAIAACFDHAQALSLLAQLDRCAIDFAVAAPSSAPPSAQALLLRGWLVSRAAQFEGKVALRGQPDSKALCGSLLSVTLYSRRTGARVAATWQGRGEDIAVETAAAQGAPVRRQLLRNKPADETDLLHDSIDVLSANPLLEAALV